MSFATKAEFLRSLTKEEHSAYFKADMAAGGTRKKPIHFGCPSEAVARSKEWWRAIWCRIEGYPGVFHIYPGGRKIHYNKG